LLVHVSALAALLVLPTAWFEAQRPPHTWRLSERPVLSIGSQDGAGPESFGRVRGTVRLSSGAVVVVDGMNMELRLFSPAGKPLRTSGRRGAGPGEFRLVGPVRRCAGDSTFVYDPSLWRISVFSPDGVYTRALDVHTLSGNELSPSDFRCNSGGTLAFVHRSAAPPTGIGPRRPDVAITVLAPNANAVKLGTFPASERYFLGQEDVPRPLGKQTSVALGSTFAYVGTGDAFEVAQFSLRGERVDTVRDSRAAVPVTAAHVNRFITQELARRAGRDTRRIERLYRGIEYPGAFPAYANLMVDGLDNLWIEGYPIPGKELRDWSIYSPTGTAIGVLRVPSNLQLLEAGRDYVLGVWRDELDVEFVQVYSLVK